LELTQISQNTKTNTNLEKDDEERILSEVGKSGVLKRKFDDSLVVEELGDESNKRGRFDNEKTDEDPVSILINCDIVIDQSYYFIIFLIDFYSTEDDLIIKENSSFCSLDENSCFVRKVFMSVVSKDFFCTFCKLILCRFVDGIYYLFFWFFNLDILSRIAC
jgi:hypothetical protein